MGLPARLLLICSAFMYANGYTNCYNCRRVTDPDACVQITTCQSDEMCHTSTKQEGGTTLHTFGCLNAALCKFLMKRVFADYEMCYGYDPSNPKNLPSLTAQCGTVVGKRQASGLCDTCCNDNICNYGTCTEIRERLYLGYKQGTIDPDSLRNVTSSG